MRAMKNLEPGNAVGRAVYPRMAEFEPFSRQAQEIA
jgi:hypothetical protein